MQQSWEESMTINPSTRVIRNRAHESTINLLEMNNESITLHEDDEKELLEMKQILRRYIAFNQFMRYSIKEYNAVPMLSIIKMLQFKKRIYRETIALDQSQRRQIKASDRRNLSKHFLVIPSECPQSRLVYGKNGHRSYKE